ncbi:MAG: type II secretion system protein, partial [bacterium]|nr:type II secretion system protein [bacterium]
MRKLVRGFTLVELTIVIGILTILGSAAVILLNPAELYQRVRDSARISDLRTLSDAINLYTVEVGEVTPADLVYISLPSERTDCSDLTLPGLPPNWGYRCAD